MLSPVGRAVRPAAASAVRPSLTGRKGPVGDTRSLACDRHLIRVEVADTGDNCARVTAAFAVHNGAAI